MPQLVKLPCRSGSKILLQLGCSILAAVMFAGCSSSSRTDEDTAPADIRGEPINTPKPEARSELAGNTTQPSAEQTPVQPRPLEKPNAAADSSIAQTGPTPAPGQTETSTQQNEEFLQVTFDKLASFTFEIPDEQPMTNAVVQPSKSEEQIPPPIKALDQRKVALKGFMLPLRVESGLVTELLIMRDQSMCCYGTVPKITEWVSVKMSNKGVKAIMDQPVTIFGKLRVGEMRENGYLVGIYAMDGEKMAGPIDL
ncbi:MAG: DUF3299 domain-containing protein [Verrucomicrobia bacterium]|nr:DUF3299 domain-containing protein [Verrucomicrobiota bacterium]